MLTDKKKAALLVGLLGSAMGGYFINKIPFVPNKAFAQEDERALRLSKIGTLECGCYQLVAKPGGGLYKIHTGMGFVWGWGELPERDAKGKIQYGWLEMK